MKRPQLVAILILILTLLRLEAPVIADDSCDCPKLSCNPECEIEQSVTFYSEKCMGGSRVKSCAKPSCVAIPDAPKHCGIGKSDATAKDIVAEKPAEPVDRMPASEPEVMTVGEIGLMEGSVFRVVGTKKTPLQRGAPVREGDMIETADGGKAQVLFKSGNILNVTPNSVVRINEMTDHVPNNDKRRAVLELLKGKIRNKVKAEYEGAQSYYRVKVGAAVAGVRGTDFVVTMDQNENDVISKVETLSGKVELSDQMFERKLTIAKNEGATFVAPKESVFNSKDRADFIAKGYLTPLYKLTESEVAKLNTETTIEVAKAGVKSKKLSLSERPICANPDAQLNQCAWICENNPAGEKRCRTDLPSVSCVRRICNANGSWSEPTRLPAAYHDRCEAMRAVVRPCDY